jgi:Asp-tRNA(Asn)/Glu-tRNA(Gln) amidotransferase A subunit family amidase
MSAGPAAAQNRRVLLDPEAGLPMTPPSAEFTEATISDVQQRMRDGSLTCEALVRWYLDRIERLDRSGPALHAIVNVNPSAIGHARELDAHLRETGRMKGPLHGVPVLVKDQAQTSFAPTTFGSRAYVDHLPPDDAVVVRRLREAGAVVLAKTSMCDFAAGWFSFSSVTERTRNPYALDRDAGGSSAGTGAGVAANFGLVGIGEDTGGSIRIPASFNNLFGLRVTTGLVSRTGFSPLVHFQDTPGPMARTVRDLAKLLDVLVGYDPLDPYTAAAAMASDAGRYEAQLELGRLDGVRIGVLAQGFGGSDPSSAQVDAVVRATLDRLAAAGAQLVEVDLPTVDDWIGRTSLYIQQSKADLDAFMATRKGTEAHSFAQIYARGWFHPLNDLFHNLATGPDRAEDAPGYLAGRLAQHDFQRVLLGLYAAHGLDFLAYPDVRVLPPTYAELEAEKWSCLTFPTNTVIASQSHLPALSMPAGFTTDGLPVGVELVGKPWSEARMLQFAHAYERLCAPRRAPALA